MDASENSIGRRIAIGRRRCQSIAFGATINCFGSAWGEFFRSSKPIERPEGIPLSVELKAGKVPLIPINYL
jgi:hypothetical protein